VDDNDNSHHTPWTWGNEKLEGESTTVLEDSKRFGGDNRQNEEECYEFEEVDPIHMLQLLMPNAKLIVPPTRRIV
jgi:hypothetical protein